MSLPDLGTISHAPLPGHDISVKEMYNIAMRNDAVWGIEGYTVPRQYHDGRKKADKQPAPRALKKTDYLTDHLRATKSVPAPNHYVVMKPWVDEKNKPGKKHATKKNSYIDNIIREQTLKPTPGPGAHNLRETEEQMKKRLAGHKGGKGSERTNFLCEMEYLSQTVPGPGNYNPRQIEPKIKEARMKPEDWKKKHGEFSKKSKKSTFPDVGTYNPHSVDFRTFAKDMELRKEKKDQKNVKIWGTATRFASKKDSKKDPNNFPGPGFYPMIASWNGKSTEKKPKDLNYMNRLTKGIEKSIYYS